MSGCLKKASYFPSLPPSPPLLRLISFVACHGGWQQVQKVWALPAQGHWDCLNIISFSVLILSYNLLFCCSKIKLLSKRVDWTLRADPGRGQASSRLSPLSGRVSAWDRGRDAEQSSQWRAGAALCCSVVPCVNHSSFSWQATHWVVEHRLA